MSQSNEPPSNPTSKTGSDAQEEGRSNPDSLSIPEVDVSDDPESQRLALEEAGAFASGEDLEKIAKRKDHNRREHIKDKINEAAGTLIGITGLVVMFAILSWAFHLLSPPAWHYLSQQQVGKIETIVLSGAVAWLAQKYIENHL